MPRCGLKTEERSFDSRTSNKGLKANPSQQQSRGNHQHLPYNKYKNLQLRAPSKFLRNNSATLAWMEALGRQINTTFKKWQTTTDKPTIRSLSITVWMDFRRITLTQRLRSRLIFTPVMNSTFLTWQTVAQWQTNWRGTELSTHPLWCVKDTIRRTELRLSLQSINCTYENQKRIASLWMYFNRLEKNKNRFHFCQNLSKKPNSFSISLLPS